MSETETWYRTGHDTIEAVKVTKYTDNTVWVDRGAWGIRRQSRRSEYRAFFPTWKEARDHLEAEARKELEAAQRHLDTARFRLATIQAMKEPGHD